MKKFIPLFSVMLIIYSTAVKAEENFACHVAGYDTYYLLTIDEEVGSAVWQGWPGLITMATSEHIVWYSEISDITAAYVHIFARNTQYLYAASVAPTDLPPNEVPFIQPLWTCVRTY